MSFSNPYGQAGTTSAAYVTALIERLEGRDPLDIMREQPAALREVLDGVPEEVLRRPEAPGKWSAKEVLMHLVDSEVVNGYRMRFIVAQPEQDIAGYDQDQWAKALRYNDAPAAVALDVFELLRAWNLEWLGTLSDDERQRWGMHSERGQESIERLEKLLGAHDLVHLDQIRRILSAVS